MSDFDHDLYGDLDLEDLDATQLDEELVDPDLEPDVHSSVPVPPSHAMESHSRPEPPLGSSAGASDAAAPAFDAHAASRPPPMGMVHDRMKPSDMPDEGLVAFVVASLKLAS